MRNAAAAGPSQSRTMKSVWKYEAVASAETIRELARDYLTIVYPIFPVFHSPTFMQNIEAGLYTAHRPFFVTTMVVCAVVSARLRHGAGLPHAHTDPETIVPSTEAFYAAAVNAFPKDLSTAREFEYKRAKALLAIFCLQQTDIVSLHTHLGDYVTLSMNDGFYDEARWPINLPQSEVQERRRLFWSTYTLEIFTAITWGGLVRHRQSMSSVAYPAETEDDEHITGTQCIVTPGAVSFLRGWNATTDLYRILEYLVDRARTQRVHGGDQMAGYMAGLWQPAIGPSTTDILALVEDIQAALPAQFKTVPPMTGDSKRDRYGFQAANLTLTVQTIKMLLAGAEESSIEHRCSIAGQLVHALASIPTAYVAAISVPMLHHMASVGHLLAGVIHSPLNQLSLLQIRSVLLTMADLISSLELALSSSADISAKLKQHVTIIDKHVHDLSLAWNPNALQSEQLASQFVPEQNTLPPELFNVDPNPAPVPDALQDWTFAFSPDHQQQLRSDLTQAWPFELETFGGYESFWDLQDTAGASGTAPIGTTHWTGQGS
ncbi:hypothetical protein Q5752_000314 [Cryptotrichosporon argae]